MIYKTEIKGDASPLKFTHTHQSKNINRYKYVL